MHRTTYTTRQIDAGDLPHVPNIDGSPRPATERELLDMGIRKIAEGIYSVVEIEDRHIDPETGAQTWTARGRTIGGTVLTSGRHNRRYVDLPAEIRAKVMKARVLRSSDPATSLRSIAVANVNEARRMVTEHVGAMVARTSALFPLVSGQHDHAIVEAEAKRLRHVHVERDGAEHPEPVAVEVTIPMSEVASEDIVDVDHVIPHAWAGELAR